MWSALGTHEHRHALLELRITREALRIMVPIRQQLQACHKVTPTAEHLSLGQWMVGLQSARTQAFHFNSPLRLCRRNRSRLDAFNDACRSALSFLRVPNLRFWLDVPVVIAYAHQNYPMTSVQSSSGAAVSRRMHDFRHMEIHSMWQLADQERHSARTAACTVPARLRTTPARLVRSRRRHRRRLLR